MALDETSLAVGRLQAQHQALQADITEMKERTTAIDEKLDRLLARPATQHLKFTFKHWGTLLAGSSIGGGGLAHVLRKVLE